MTAGETEPPALAEPFAQDMVARGREAFNAHDAERLVALMTEDVLYDHSAWPTTLRGRAQVRSFYTDYLWKAFPDLRLEPEDGPFLHPHAPQLAMAWRAVGTHTGPIQPPGFAPTGKRMEVSAREIAEFRDGRVSRVQIVVDMAAVLRQLGMLPAQGSRAERGIAALQRLQIRVSRRARSGRP
jgi:steroid delta-isomerase-like uncharacterized protein